MQASTNKSALLMNTVPHNQVMDAYRSLKLKIRLSRQEEPIRSVLITSSVRGEGKTTTAMNIAVAFARESQNVLLIDSDLQRPVLHNLFGRSNHIGLANLLVGEVEWSEALQETSFDKLTLLSAGNVSGSAIDYGTLQVKSIVERAKQLFDIVIIDSPAVLESVDTQLFAAECDGAIFVIRCNQTKQSKAKEAVEVLQRINASVLGVVMNDAKIKKVTRK
ncbi:CpsD/CapB family tyrosine-protein kinase [Paenibacillus flagellatus]|uniref:non-specific protein-tyrosine kinase n=1 Tax=Paenibacillus flagellatus TaxID=2211139 RepID=A0A2V5KFG9_9BACL|nr:CpsD/CapB family tyrosine-protein kinase [Paenibacillus flagellatus]PYI57204.1 capsular biosynthesis protein [Paenibacillus flagellatus]